MAIYQKLSEFNQQISTFDVFSSFRPYRSSSCNNLDLGHSCEGRNLLTMICYVYIMASGYNGTLYIGVSYDLVKRVWQHKNKIADGFSKKYGTDNLVYFEIHNDISSAIKREKQMKKWKRTWKINMIEKSNPRWEDLYSGIL